MTEGFIPLAVEELNLLGLRAYRFRVPGYLFTENFYESGLKNIDVKRIMVKRINILTNHKLGITEAVKLLEESKKELKDYFNEEAIQKIDLAIKRLEEVRVFRLEEKDE